MHVIDAMQHVAYLVKPWPSLPLASELAIVQVTTITLTTIQHKPSYCIPQVHQAHIGTVQLIITVLIMFILHMLYFPCSYTVYRPK